MLTPDVSATLGFYDPDTQRSVPANLTPVQQAVVDRYAAGALFTLTGIVNGELLTPDYAEIGGELPSRDLIAILDSAVVNAAVLALELQRRLDEAITCDEDAREAEDVACMADDLAAAAALVSRLAPGIREWPADI